MTAQAEEIIDISDDRELRRLAEEVQRTGHPRLLRVENEDVAMLVPMRVAHESAEPDYSQEDFEAFLSAAGGWKGLIDGEALKRQIRESRGSNRPLVEL